MTAEEWETLKQAQRQALKGGSLADINRINKMLFDEREKVLSAKILEFRKQGYKIETEYKTGKTRYGTHTTYANYILKGEN